jgi:hypothetical protein
MTQKGFDLDIRNYTLKELFSLFNLDDQKSITVENLKNAKKKVLSMHPDKSHLPSEYFLFYKKAFDILNEFHINHQRIDQEITEESVTYKEEYKTEENKTNMENIQKSIKNMKKEDFHQTFNELFEKNRITQNKMTNNNWFTNEAKLYEANNGSKNINEDINRIKRIQAQGQLTKFRGIQTFNSMSGTSMYDDLDKTEDEENEYFTCDPFSKLQYEDIRKVHRDETVFLINENDFNGSSLAKNQKELEIMRNEQLLTPMSEKEARESIDNQERLHQIKMTEKQYASKLKGLQHEEKNKSILSYFLRLGQ